METREIDGVWMTKDTIEVTYFGIDQLADAIKEAKRRFTDPRFHVEIHSSYGDDFPYAEITGWRKATPKEIQERKRELKQAEEQQRQWDERQLAELRKRYPNQFK